MDLIIHWLVSSLVIVISAYLLPGVHVKGFLAALSTAVVLAVLNLVVRPILLFLTLPINILTLGLFTLVINAGIIMLASAIVPGFKVDSWWWALLFSIVVTLITLVFGLNK
jgi:putative membrane protein